MGEFSIMYEDAVKALKHINSFKDLAALIAKLDAKGTGTTTLLYSGPFSADISAGDLARGMADSNKFTKVFFPEKPSVSL